MNMEIYKITNDINGKIYIGQTIQSTKMRWLGHLHSSKDKLSAIDSAIKKYGRENFSVQTIDYGNSIDELNEKEIFWIAFLRSTSPNGYNISSGGFNRFTSDESKRKSSETHKARQAIHGNPRSKRVYQYTLDGIFVAEYKSMREAARLCGMHGNAIASVCRGEHYYCGDYRWTTQKGVLSDAPTKSFRLIEHNGVLKTMKQWSNEMGIPYSTFQMRIKHGLTGERLFAPIDRSKSPTKRRN